MPGRWVTRKDADGFVVDEPLECYVAHAIVATPGVRTVEGCIAQLLDDDEAVRGIGNDLEIVKGGEVVGTIEIRYRPT